MKGNDMKELLLDKIQHRTALIGVVGLGYVGLPLAVEKAKAGFRTIGFDVQPGKVDMVNRGENYIGDVVDSDLASLVRSGMLRATNRFDFIEEVDFIAICVPTPLDAHQQPDTGYVKSSVESIASHLKKDTVVVLDKGFGQADTGAGFRFKVRGRFLSGLFARKSRPWKFIL